MTKKDYNKVEAFFKGVSWERGKFNRKVMEGLSLKNLQSYLSALGLEVNTKTISAYLKLHPEIREERKIEKGLRKRVSRKLNYFIKPQLPQTKRCSHEETFSRWIMRELGDPKVQIVCLKCKKVISEFDPEEHEKKMNSDSRLKEIYRRLTLSRKQK